jgi:O-antigen ligase
MPHEVTVAVGVIGVVVLGFLALQRFEWFIWMILLVRPVVDLTKGSTGVSAGSGTVATIVGGAVILVGLLWLAGLSRQRGRLRMGFISRALLLLMLSSVISVGFSSQPLTSALQVARTLGAVMVFLVLEQLLRSPALVRRALIVCAVSALAPLLVGGMQFLSRGGATNGLNRVTGSFTHPNTFGFFLVMLILMGYALRAYVPGRPRWAVDALLLVAAAEMLLTYSRGGWIVLAVGLLVIGVLADRRLFVALPVVATAVWFLFPNIQARISDLQTADTVGGRPGNSLAWRLTHVQELLTARQGDPVFGIGPKMADLLVVGGRPPHNDAVRLLVENGLVGLVCYVLFLVALVALAVRALRRLRAGFGRGLAVGFSGCMVAFVVDSMGANLIANFVLLIYVLTLAAVVQAWVVFGAGGDEVASPAVPVPRALLNGWHEPPNVPAPGRSSHGTP